MIRHRLTRQPDSVHPRREGATGVLCAFPDDGGETGASNSEPVVLTIERPPEVPAGAPSLVIDAQGQARAETSPTRVAFATGRLDER